MRGKDTLYATEQIDIAGFRFDNSVVDVFPDMIKRSVPGYATIISMTGTMAEHYVQPGSRCYDLGCSLGASTIAIRNGIDGLKVPDCQIVAVDNSPDMIRQCRQVLSQTEGKTPVTLLCDDIRNINIENASLVVLNFTLQFVPLAQRDPLIEKISAGLRPGGALVLSEKISFEHRQHDQLMQEMHHDFKRANGYSDLEISQKRSALEEILVPETPAAHRQRLTAAGFSSVDLWFQCFNFASFVAIK